MEGPDRWTATTKWGVFWRVWARLEVLIAAHLYASAARIRHAYALILPVTLSLFLSGSVL